MFIHLFLFCLYSYFGTSARLLTQRYDVERRMIYPVQLGTLKGPRNEHKSSGHWSQLQLPDSDSNEIQRPMLKARAGDATGKAILDKQFNKKINKATTRWENSINGKALNKLFHEIIAMPFIEITDALVLTTGNTQRDVFVDQWAVMESLLKILDQKFKFDKSKVTLINYDLQDHDKGIMNRRGYTVVNNRGTAISPNVVLHTSFVFNTFESPDAVAASIGTGHVFPSLYLGISPRFVIQDTLRRPLHHASTYLIRPQMSEVLRDQQLLPFVNGRPFHDLVLDPGFKSMKPPMAVFWNPKGATQPTPDEVAHAAASYMSVDTYMRERLGVEWSDELNAERLTARPSSQPPPGGRFY